MYCRFGLFRGPSWNYGRAVLTALAFMLSLTPPSYGASPDKGQYPSDGRQRSPRG